MVQHTSTFTENTLDEYYRFRTWGRESILFVVFMPTPVSQYETTSTVFLPPSRGRISTLPAVKE
jgi:hypothetical protein